MRMRKKKNLETRLEEVKEYILSTDCEEKDFEKEVEKTLFNYKEVFGNSNPVRLEIGCGKGTFVCETAKRNPDKFFVAVEKVRDVMVMAMEKCVAAELKNVVFADIDAAKLGEVFAEGELSGIFFYGRTIIS